MGLKEIDLTDLLMSEIRDQIESLLEYAAENDLEFALVSNEGENICRLEVMEESVIRLILKKFVDDTEEVDITGIPKVDAPTDTFADDCKAILAMYANICVSYPKLRTLTDKRKKAIKARLKKFNLSDFEKVFKNAEASDFLKGGNNRNWSAKFDWMIGESNFVKILEGNYNNGTSEDYLKNIIEGGE